MKELPDFISFKYQPGQPLHTIFTAAGDDLLRVLTSMLSMDPNKRCGCTQALKMPYFSNKPAPTPPAQLPKLGGHQAAPEISRVNKRTGEAIVASAKRLHFDDE